jgi:four helix bundle protein
MSAHRDLEAWIAARAVVVTVLRTSRTAWQPYLSEIFRQLQRSSLSAQLNIAEGYASGPGARCRHMLVIAYGSAVETDDLLELLRDEGHLPASEAETALAQCRRCQRLLRGLIKRYQ